MRAGIEAPGLMHERTMRARSHEDTLGVLVLSFAALLILAGCNMRGKPTPADVCRARQMCWIRSCSTARTVRVSRR